MPEIVLTTCNAKYIHASFGLRYLMANLGPLQERAVVREFDISQRAADVVESVLAENPRIVGLGVYIWNAALSNEVVQILKRVAPDVQVVLGGPEVSFETEQQEIVKRADYVIPGEADLKFRELCSQLLEGITPSSKVIPAELPDLMSLKMPYSFYNEDDVAHRIIYVEASRGCPFTCEFCLSSLDVPVRQFPVPVLLRELEKLLHRGVKHFKFVDRTFNLNLNTSKAILEFFLERYRPGLFFHFEMIPDRLPEGLREVIAKFPPGVLQFEVGIQTFNPEVAGLISRRQNYQRLTENLAFLREHTGVHLHVDLIAGLPGETWDSFAVGFDRLVAMRPQEIQLGILKRLRGTPIVRHDATWEMIYNPVPPYELLENKTLSFQQMQKLRRFARHWDLVVNSGNFPVSAPLIWAGNSSPFAAFLRFSDYLFKRTGKNYGIALSALAEYLFEFLKDDRHEAHPLAERILRDYQRSGRSDTPPFLRPYLSEEKREPTSKKETGGLKRQARHLQAFSQ